ncbi:MAG: zinc-binding dehydrogenase [Alphaproteobacteria bacterium]
MRVAAVHAHGGIEQLKLETWPDPAPKAGEVVIETKACGLNHLDLFVIRGMPGLPLELPIIPGGDFAGVVVAVGEGVRRRWLGRRVVVDPWVIRDGKRISLGEHANGGLCEKAVAPAENLIPLADEVPFETAAALPIAYGAAYRMLTTRGAVEAGELVLVIGASGGVGVASLQLAKLLGAKVIACTLGAAKADKLRSCGADWAIDYGAEDFSAAAWRISERRGVDVVINYTGGDTWVPSLKALRRGGRLLTCGATAGFDPKEDIRYIWSRELTIIGSNGWERRALRRLLNMAHGGWLKPVIDRVVPFERLHEALRALRDREILGKIIVTP